MIDFDTFTKFPKNVGDLGKLIVAIGLTCPKSNKSPNLITLLMSDPYAKYALSFCKLN